MAIPVALYFPLDPLPSLVFLQTATFSMMPLLRQDQLLLPSIVLSLIYLLSLRIVNHYRFLPIASTMWHILFYATLVWQFALTGLLAFVQPPVNLPHLFPLLIAASSAGYFGAFFLYWNWQQCFGENGTNQTQGIQKKGN